MMAEALLVFIASGGVIVLAGSALTRAADAIAHETGLGGLWIGAVLLATATSLPELSTDVAAVRLGTPDLAAGDVFGSSMANMAVGGELVEFTGFKLFYELDRPLMSEAEVLALRPAPLFILYQ